MNNVVTFYRKQPQGITVNGERIDEEAIEAAMAQFADSPKPREAAARSLVVRAVLRQRAAALKIEADDEEAAIEKMLEQEVSVPPVSEEEIRRYYEGNRQKFRSGDLFEVRHILFAPDEETDAKELARKADAALFQIKDDPESFERVAREQSACSSAKLGGALGQISQGGVVPEFWAALVGFGKAGLLPQPVESRFGQHIVLVDRCAIGEPLPFEAVQARVRDYLVGRLERLTCQQYVAQLIEQSQITGIDLGDQRPQPAGPGLPLE